MTNLRIRVATEADLPALRGIMARAIPALLADFLAPEQVEASVEIMGLDTQLVTDGTYFVAEAETGEALGCGGWSFRATTHGGDHAGGRDARRLDPAAEPARIRAMYTEPAAARRGVGRAILAACEAAAAEAGFSEAELVATLAGEPLYRACGWREIERMAAPTRSSVEVPILRMGKRLVGAAPT